VPSINSAATARNFPPDEAQHSQSWQRTARQLNSDCLARGKTEFAYILFIA
jgi:hypothetical protein